jgi:hypothetical protein
VDFLRGDSKKSRLGPGKKKSLPQLQGGGLPAFLVFVEYFTFGGK